MYCLTSLGRSRFLRRSLLCFLSTAFLLLNAAAQTKTGQIIRPAVTTTTGWGSYGKYILDPNGDGYVSRTNAGFPNSLTASSYGSVGGDDTSYISQGSITKYAGNTPTVYTVNTTNYASEIPYKPVKPYGGEPCCDLRRGADHRFSDFVPDDQNNGVYLAWVDLSGATNPITGTANSLPAAKRDWYLMIRMRMGTVIPGAKGFSLLVDTDMKYGNTGTSKDANYVAQTTGINGNRGFELEIVLETGFRTAIYNIDGKGQPNEGIDRQNPPMAFYDYDWDSRSQISMAASTENGDPDYFIDWFVSLSELQSIKSAMSGGTSYITAQTQNIRIIPTTVMAPKPSTAGPISDIYGYLDSVSYQPPVCSSCSYNAVCTPAPSITSLSLNTTWTVNGGWTKDNYGSNTAVITLYKVSNSVETQLGTYSVTATSGAGWSISGITSGSGSSALAIGDVIVARAKGSSNWESNYCFASPARTVNVCTSYPTSLSVSLVAEKGFVGSGYTAYNGSNAGLDYIAIYKVPNYSSGTYITPWRIGAVSQPAFAKLNGGSATNNYDLNGASSGGAWNWNGGSGGSANASITAGQYMVYDSTTSGCTSKPTFVCLATAGNGQSVTNATTPGTTPTISGTLYPSTRQVTGTYPITASASSFLLRFWLEDASSTGKMELIGTQTITTSTSAATNWTFDLPSTTTLAVGQIFHVRAQQAESGATYYCATAATSTVQTESCISATPYFDVDNTTGNLMINQMLSGIGTPGSTVQVFQDNSASASSTNGTPATSTFTVGTDGTWTTYISATNYIAVPSSNVTSFTVKQTTGSCAVASSTLTVYSNVTPSTYCGGTISGVQAGGYVSGGIPLQTLYSNESALYGTLNGSAAPTNTTVNVYVNGTTIASYKIGRLNGVSMVSNSAGWAVGNWGQISKYNGTSWSTETSNTTKHLYRVAMLTTTSGWAVGEGGTLLQYSGGTPTWSTQTSGTTNDLYGLYFLNATTGWAVGASGTFLKYSSGWSVQTALGTAQLNGVHMFDATHGAIVGNSGTVYYYNTGSSTFTAGSSGTSNNLNSVYFVSQTVGFAVGDAGTILKTTDGGATWSSPLTSPATSTKNHLYRIYMTSTTTGWVVGANGTIIYTTDAGLTWAYQTSNTTNTIYGASFTGTTTGWVVADGGSIQTTSNTGTTWTTQASNITSSKWGPVSVANKVTNGSQVTISVVQSGTDGEYLCASMVVDCACKLSLRPNKPTIGEGTTQTKTTPGTFTVTVSNPISGTYYSLKKKNTGTYLTTTKGKEYSGTGSQSLSRVYADELVMNTQTISATTDGTVTAVRSDELESCHDSTAVTFRIGTFLPVTLLEFNGRRDGARNLLFWQTTAEENFAYFGIERSEDGIRFEEIAQVAGSGRGNYYQYGDADLRAQGYFYRLRMVDRDARFRYSHIILLRESGSSVTLNTVRPNPFKNSLRVGLMLAEGEKVQMVLIDAAGRPVRSKSISAVRGLNDLLFDGLEGLTAGTYLLKVYAGMAIFQQKVVSVR